MTQPSSELELLLVCEPMLLLELWLALLLGELLCAPDQEPVPLLLLWEPVLVAEELL